MEIANFTKSKVSERKLKKIADKAAAFLDGKKLTDVSLVIVGEARMKNLNKRYRGKNSVTDVLSFEGLDEIVICLPQAAKQAKAQKTPLNSELTRLFVHGIVHLRHYDHKTLKEAKMMAAVEEKILNAL
ncbi:MAG: rRNA maturation RNase YbeY [Candidatus Portnoybacteria bacterium]|jgi:probable rRNA maturation factor|nr:rRNA maturation RNase YbeY [Candidatus Portnoybacteria bacterium]